jgi:hypothetical protein
VSSDLEREMSLERRQYTPEKAILWDKLSLAQKFTTSSLTKYGYELSFIRGSKSGNVAILLRDGDAATISHDGEINTSPNIIIRP